MSEGQKHCVERMDAPNCNINQEAAKNPGVGREMAEMLLHAGFANARAVKALEGRNLPEYIDLPDILEVLVDQVAATKAMCLEQQEGMLLGQAVTLQHMFSRLIERASEQNLAEHHYQFLKLALRAQNQSRATLQALGDLRTPRSHVFARQANIAQNQQINHTHATPADSSKFNPNAQNELLEDDADGQRLDSRTESSTGRGDPALEAVATGHGAEDN
ncbi:hypothetical protein [Ectothiorhodospira variabilis]|uniref:hypothetical protein n=1 Tax=Ectothiorhodospira variabilis TaxID=505694 RepID=UPI001EFAF2AD|nr:hypothetical protein [Ectothiorhodospira variabilis]MCG5494415.1 hypothetical protein [Ectothiorhodospira variabilis]MCG5503214.1 hypothetical protein [Ectothiorhodospira variabilis]MCG5506027.1 hypothetical protein [Ectothiorhodospira variabilis]